MTPKDFTIWLKGFVEACHEYTPTPKQWDSLKDKLSEVKDSYQIEVNQQLPIWTSTSTTEKQLLND